MPAKTISHHIIICLLALFTLSHTSLAHAKTWFIERWGEDTIGPPSCGKKTTPCLTIQFVLDNLATKNDRLIVGPGKYVENIVIFGDPSNPLDGIRLESTAGRNGTIIETASDGADIITVYRSRVQIGRKGKGFTLKGNLTGGFGIFVPPGVDAFRLKIEGNRILDNYYGINVRGERSQVRGNIVINNWHESSGYGIACHTCDNALIQDNEVSGNNGSISGRGIYVQNSTRFSVLRNRVSDHDSAGIESTFSSSFGKIKDNFVAGGYSPMHLSDIDGARVQGNIVSEGEQFGVILTQSNHTRPPRITNNLVLDSASLGMYLQGLDGGRVERNTVVDSADTGFYIDSNIVDGPILNYNNSSLSGNNCGLENRSTTLALIHKKHFFSAGDAVCGPGEWDAGSTDSSRPSPLRVNRARAL